MNVDIPLNEETKPNPKVFYTFPKGISLKVTVIALLEFKLPMKSQSIKWMSAYNSCVGMFSVIIIVVRNGIGNQSSNPGQCCLCFTLI